MDTWAEAEGQGVDVKMRTQGVESGSSHACLCPSVSMCGAVVLRRCGVLLWGVSRSYNLGLSGRGQLALTAMGAWDTVAKCCAVVVGRKVGHTSQHT